MQVTHTIRSPVLPLVEDDVDTDQIAPARFLATTERGDLSEVLFADRREQAREAGQTSVFDDPAFEDAEILLTGENFGCGSSREHAVWALVDHGFRAVVARSFADIFQANALRNGLLPVQLDPEDHEDLVDTVQAQPSTAVTIDVADAFVSWGYGAETCFEIDAFHQRCLLEGKDVLNHLVELDPWIEAYENQTGRRPRAPPRGGAP